jgi:ABC-type lipoprotein export system ATPase subunit
MTGATPRLAIDGLQVSYGRLRVLMGVDLVVDPGQIVAVRAPSGTGKTTLLYCAGLLLRPTSGEVRIDGQQTSVLSDRLRSRLRAREIGFVFQDAQLNERFTVLDNILEGALYGGCDRSRARLRATSLSDELEVRVPLGRRANRLSSGQAQRIALCRALVKSPTLILADEPTGNLDKESADLVVARLRREAGLGASVVVATHSDHVAALADRELWLPTADALDR